MEIGKAIRKIDNEINSLEAYIDSCFSVSEETTVLNNKKDDLGNLKNAKGRLEKIQNSATDREHLNIPKKLAKIIGGKEYNAGTISDISSLITQWQNDRDNRDSPGLKSTAKSSNEESTSDNATGTERKKFIDFLPLIFALIVLALGLSLGLTVFKEIQDGWYFALESVKDIAASAISWLGVKQIVNSKRADNNRVWIVVVGGIVGILSLIFSVVLWVGAYYSIIERFTEWNKFNYIWISLGLIFICVCSALSVSYYIFAHRPKKDVSDEDGGNL